MSEPAGADAKLRQAVLTELENGGYRMLASMLDDGDWQIQGNELTIKAAASEVVVEMAFGAAPKKTAIAAASNAAGRPMRVRVVGGAAGNGKTRPGSNNAQSGGGEGRSRAVNDPVVRRMQEKFGAEIRTIIDHRDKR